MQQRQGAIGKEFVGAFRGCPEIVYRLYRLG